MKNLHKIIGLFSLLVVLSITGCKKEEYSFGAMKTPSGKESNFSSITIRVL